MGMVVLILSQNVGMPDVPLWIWKGKPKAGQAMFEQAHGYPPTVAYMRLDSPNVYYMVEDDGKPTDLVRIPFALKAS